MSRSTTMLTLFLFFFPGPTQLGLGGCQDPVPVIPSCTGGVQRADDPGPAPRIVWSNV